MLGSLFRKCGRTAQVHLPFLQDAGKYLESTLRRMTGRAHDPDFEGIRLINAPPRALYLDIGANRGAAIQSILMLDPDATIVAFEPNPGLANRVSKNMRGREVTVHAVALSDQGGHFPLFVPVYAGLEFDGLASLNDADARSWLSPQTLFGFNESKLSIRQIPCRVSTLDSFGLQPFFIKIDVQGRERQVIAGGLTTIAAAQPIIFAESESLAISDVLSLLAPWGYAAFHFEAGHFHRGASATNTYFVPDSQASRIPVLR